jgi:hypothetical protein
MKQNLIILIILSIFINFSYCQNIKFNELDSNSVFSIVGNIKNDTIIFMYSGENKKMEFLGRLVIFAKKDKSKYFIISEYEFIDVFTIKYIINDFDEDGINEVLVIPMDEAYYDLYLFKISNYEKIKIDKVLLKENLWTPQKENFGIYKVRRNNIGKISCIYFFDETEDGKIISYRFYFSKEKNKFILEKM